MQKKYLAALAVAFLSASAYMPEMVSAHSASHVALTTEDIRGLIVKKTLARKTIPWRR